MFRVGKAFWKNRPINEATGVDLPFHFSHKTTSMDARTGQKNHLVK